MEFLTDMLYYLVVRPSSSEVMADICLAGFGVCLVLWLKGE